MKLLLVILCSAMLTPLMAQKSWEKDMEVAEAYMSQHAYRQAITYYDLAVQVKATPAAYEQLGHAYFQLREFKEALSWWQKLGSEFDVSAETRLHMARAQFYLGSYDRAVALAQSIDDSTLRSKANLLIASADSVRSWSKAGTNIRVRNMKMINSTASDIAPALQQGRLVFSSDRQGVIIKRNFEQTGQRFFDLYVTSKNAKNRWGSPALFSAGINSPNHEGAACFNREGNEIYFTRSEYTQSENKNHSDENRLKLYKSTKKSGRWSKPLWFMMNDSLHSFGHPCISGDGSYFFFVADLPQGYGGTDIYMSLKITDSTWSEPINLGASVNTAENELYPYLAENDYLYFSSNGHPGYGAYDLYRTIYSDGAWQTPENMLKGINSSYDDFSLIFLTPNHQGVFCSNRKGGKGKEDLYQFLIE